MGDDLLSGARERSSTPENSVKSKRGTSQKTAMIGRDISVDLPGRDRRRGEVEGVGPPTEELRDYFLEREELLLLTGGRDGRYTLRAGGCVIVSGGRRGGGVTLFTSAEANRNSPTYPLIQIHESTLSADYYLAATTAAL